MALTGLRTLDELAVDETFLDEEHRALRETVRKVVEAEVLPYADQWEQDRRVPDSAWQKSGEVGLLGLTFRFLAVGGGSTEVMLDEVARLL